MAVAGPAPVVVGVDGTPGSDRAVRYAVEEAGRAGAGLRLVHVAPDYTPTTPMLPLIREDFEQVGRRVLAEAAALVAESAPDREVTMVLRTGPTVATLLRELDDAGLLVLGREHRPRVETVFTGSTTVGAAARADRPVVCVPPAWVPGSTRGRVVAGVRAAGQSVELLGHALAAAGSRDARLVVLHAWKLPGAYDDIIEARTHADAHARETEEAIDPVLEACRRRHPDVEVELSVVHEQPARALLRAADGADLLVVGRRARGLPPVSHLGGTARTLLREAGCPVEVVPPEAAPGRLEDLVLEEAGGVRK